MKKKYKIILAFGGGLFALLLLFLSMGIIGNSEEPLSNETFSNESINETFSNESINITVENETVENETVEKPTGTSSGGSSGGTPTPTTDLTENITGVILPNESVILPDGRICFLLGKVEVNSGQLKITNLNLSGNSNPFFL